MHRNLTARVRVIHTPNELRAAPQPACAAIGVFDGLHLGHQAVLRRALDDARACVGAAAAVTFDRHPNAIVAPERTPLLIQSLSQRLQGLEKLGFDATWLIPFDRAFSQIPAETFIRDLVRGFGPVRSLSVGATFTFGYQRRGNLALLQQLGSELGFTVHGVGPVALDGQTISSTRIREAIDQGDLEAARSLLGRPYSVAGRVLRGAQLGRQIGVPTANLDVSGLVLPPTGVYIGSAIIRTTRHPAVLNLGHRPTVKSTTLGLHFEVHLLDFSGDLYDAEVEVVLHQHLRAERSFPSMHALRDQIQADIAAARRFFQDSCPEP
jgi:riboflavin kinase / FMN adenylyltransferase